MAQIENFDELKCNTYRCFSQRLSHEIQMQLGILPINRFQHKNGKMVTVFIMTPKLSKFLTEWTANKPKRGEK